MYVRFSRGFDSAEDLPAVSTARLAGLIEQNHAELVSAECRMLQLACAWAELTICTRVAKTTNR